MKAIILAGGRGKRLRPITDYIPKPLVPINNIPIIQWQLAYLQKYGIREVIVCSGYKSGMLEEFAKRHAGKINIKISAEKEPLGTAGAIKKIGRLIRDGEFFVINGDIITDIDLSAMTEKPNSVASIPLRTKFGILEADGDVITRFGEKTQLPDIWMNAGIYFLKKSVIRDLPVRGDLEKTLFPSYAERRKMTMVRFHGARWHSIDSFKDLEECSQEIHKIIK